MHFQLTDEQRVLRAGVRQLLEGRFGRDALRTAVDGAEQHGAAVLDRKLWRQLGEAGFFALRLPEEAGGVGLGLPEAVLAFEEAGRVLLPGPLVATALAAATVTGAATGTTVVTCADGPLASWLDAADVVLGDTAGARPVRSVDPLTPLHRVPSAPRPSPSDDEPAQGLRSPAGVLLCAAEQLGSAARTGELAVQHARQREQFGRPIGSFQAVQQICAQMLIRTETARAAVYAAAVTGDRLEVAGARLLADEAAVRGARDCLQVCGGMGFTWESDVHLHLKRAWLRTELGPSAAAAEEALAAAL